MAHFIIISVSPSNRFGKLFQLNLNQVNLTELELKLTEPNSTTNYLSAVQQRWPCALKNYKHT